MPKARLLLVAVLAAAWLGTLVLTVGYASYLRSPAYRSTCAAVLSAELGLPCEIGGIVPRSRMAREFRGIVVWLPERRGKAHTCESALLLYTPTRANPDEYELQLTGGASEISTRTWLRKDYRGVLESGLRPGFSEHGPRRVRFSGMDLTFERDNFRLQLDDAAGSLDFETPQRGEASVTCTKLNGHTCGEPVLLTARFSPRTTGIRIDDLTLRVPSIPLREAGLTPLIGLRLQDGHFDGELKYSEDDGGRRLVVSGHCTNLDLAQCSAGLAAIPWRGRAPEIELQELRVLEKTPQRLRFRGRVVDVDLGALLTSCGVPGMSGVATLDIGQADLSPAGIERFTASGECRGLSLEMLSKALGMGGISGTLNVMIRDLTIRDNHLASFNASVLVEDAIDPPNWVEGGLLRELIHRTLKVQLPPLLPERIEYTRLGLRLEVRDEVLYVFGSHGEHEKTILTVKLFQRELPLVFEPSKPFELKAWFDKLRERAAASVRERWPFATTSAPASQP